MDDDAQYGRNLQALARQSVLHHRKREEDLERIVADLLTMARPKCKCRVCKYLRHLARELDSSR